MLLTIHRGAAFDADFDSQYKWYLAEAGEEVAERFLNAVLATLRSLAAQPDLGRRRKFRHPMLRNLRSLQVKRPFQRVLLFYRVSEDILQAWRLMHGARDLPSRLTEL
jgi:toxin ParE1/3/4